MIKVSRKDDKICVSRARTKIEQIGTKNGFSMIRAVPLISRQYQLLIHLSYIIHPIEVDMIYSNSYKRIKDYLYGKEERGLQIRRQALHLENINLDGRIIESKIPKDMQELLADIKSDSFNSCR